MELSAGVIHHNTSEELRDSESKTAMVRIFTNPMPAVNMLSRTSLGTNYEY